jgi:hypothetical protein
VSWVILALQGDIIVRSSWDAGQLYNDVLIYLWLD